MLNDSTYPVLSPQRNRIKREVGADGESTSQLQVKQSNLDQLLGSCEEDLKRNFFYSF